MYDVSILLHTVPCEFIFISRDHYNALFLTSDMGLLEFLLSFFVLAMLFHFNLFLGENL